MPDQGKILSAVSEYVDDVTADLRAQVEQLTAQRDSARADVADLASALVELRKRLDALTPKPLVGINFAPTPGVYEPRAKVARIFFQSLKGVDFAKDKRVIRALADGITVLVISHRENDLAVVQAALATVPPGPTVYVCPFHEPEDDQQSALWKQRYVDQSPLIRAAGCIPTQILMAWTLDPASKRNPADWTAPAGTVDAYLFDAYVDKIAPDTQVSRIVAYCKSLGATRTGIVETGSLVSDAQRAEKLAALHRAMTDANQAGDVRFEVACYWNQVGKDGKDFRLNDTDADVWFGTGQERLADPMGLSRPA